MINKYQNTFSSSFVLGLQSANAQTIRIASVSGPDHTTIKLLIGLQIKLINKISELHLRFYLVDN